MTFNSQSNTITIGDKSGFLASSGAFYAKVLKDLAASGMSERITNDWRILEGWLECVGREPTDSDYAKVGDAWRSYLARGFSPSIPLEESFNKFAELAKAEGGRSIELPEDLIGVFERMIASEKEIQAKKVAKALEFEAAIRTPKAATAKPLSRDSVKSPISRKVDSLSKELRAGAVLSLAWAAFVVFQTSGGHEVLGVWLERWDGDSFLINLLLPPLGVWGAARLYKWIISANK